MALDWILSNFYFDLGLLLVKEKNLMRRSWTRVIVKYPMAGYDFDKDKKRQKVKKLKPQTISERMPSQNRLVLEHMLEYEEEPSEEFRSSVTALPVDLVSDPNKFPICK